MWRARLFLPRQQSSPSLRNHLSQIKNFYTKSASALQQLNVAMKQSNNDIQEGQVIEGFTVQQVADIPDFQMTAIRLQHDDTGAHYFHLQRDDPNNVFSINLRTTPFDSTGVPHILEHSTLCGSVKYPCRDPFFKMLNRSLATFMNAMTGPDYTLYPFASQNQTDYYNLRSVYMDAVFNPQLKITDFHQEGWRLEHENVDDPASPIVLKGVVFNEMKGALSDNQRVFSESLLNTILPGHTYSVIAGGDPLQIPNLTYAQLKGFHSRYYHPSNSRFYSYGNFPLKDNLKFINDSYLKQYGKVTENFSDYTKVPAQERWQELKKSHIYGKVDSMAANPQKQCSLAVSYLCSDINDVEETFTLQIISELLTSGPNSAFYKSLVEPNVGSGFSPVTGLESQTKDTYFTVGLQGLDKQSFDWVLQTYDHTIDNVVRQGFDKTRIEAILHNIELNTKNQSADFGLRFLFSLTPLWNHDGDLVKALRINNLVERFKDNLSKNPHFLQDKVEQYFRNNHHKLILTMTPDEEFEVKQHKMEQQILESKLLNLTPEQKKEIYNDGIILKKEQDCTQNTDCLPTLKITDLKKDIESDHLEHRTIGGVPVQICIQPTNNLTYFKGVLDTSHVPGEYKPYLSLFSSVATKMGTKRHSYRELDHLAELKTGGLSLSLHVAESKDKINTFEDGILFASYALDSNVESLFSLWEEIFNDVSFDDKARLETLMKTSAASLVSHIADNGHLYAMNASAALINPASLKNELNSGLHYIRWLCSVVQQNKFEEVLSNLNEISKNILNKKFMRLAVNHSSGSEDLVQRNVNKFVKSLQGSFEKSYIHIHDSNFDGIKHKVGVHYDTALPVSYVGKAIPAVPYNHRDFAPLRVLCRLLSSKYLLPTVREKGGAYGAGARIAPSGAVSFFSYRDPKPAQTLNTFDASLDWLNKKDFKDQDVDEAKLGTFQQVDSPVPPGARGARNFLFGITDEEFQKHRLNLMNVTRDDILRVASTYLDPSLDVCEGRVVIGPANDEISKRSKEQWKVEKL